jgi:hypothetical protein
VAFHTDYFEDLLGIDHDRLPASSLINRLCFLGVGVHSIEDSFSVFDLLFSPVPVEFIELAKSKSELLAEFCLLLLVPVGIFQEFELESVHDVSLLHLATFRGHHEGPLVLEFFLLQHYFNLFCLSYSLNFLDFREREALLDGICHHRGSRQDYHLLVSRSVLGRGVEVSF